MITFDIHPPRTINSCFQLSFSHADELKNSHIPFTEGSYIMFALRGNMKLEELRQLTNSLDERFAEREFTFEMFESLHSNISFIFN